MIRVILVDDHDMVRQGLRTLLEEQADIQVAGDAADGSAALDLVERIGPDVLVVDIALPGLSGFDVTRQVRQRFPGVRVVVLSMHSNVAHVAEALRSGAIAYVVKHEGIRELVTAVRAAALGRPYLSPQCDRAAVDAYLKRTTGKQADLYETLTGREREVLVLVAQGFTNAEIAETWVVSRRTVEAHRSHMMNKLHLKTQADVVRFALRRGLLVVEE
jgi:DNA-binding NarL/FixJ family response regulator